ncbi:MAG: D-lyxose/D-mannose family sugar isomerase [Spirochaetota bacterium]
MKRSKINKIIKEYESWIASMGFHLPPWAHWSLEQWQTNLALGMDASEIFNNMLGWDVTDFNKGNYEQFGITLFTIRNGNLQFDKKPYAEKIMLISEGQLNPMHFHWYKMEDIINRGGGRFIVEAYGSTPDGELSQDTISVKIDGIRRTYKAGSRIVLEPGESICIEPGLYHRFFAEGGTVLAGEVSMVNNDWTDNRFLEPLDRYADIEEDEVPYRLLCGDYKQFLG